MALGTVAVSPLELADRLHRLRRPGRRRAARGSCCASRRATGEVLWRPEPLRAPPVLDAGVAFLVTDVLREALRARHRRRRVGRAGFRGARRRQDGHHQRRRRTPGSSATRREVVAAVWIGFDQPRRSPTRHRRPAGRAGLGAHHGAALAGSRRRSPGAPRPTSSRCASIPPRASCCRRAAARRAATRARNCSSRARSPRRTVRAAARSLLTRSRLVLW